jgi:hypothetical protein
LKTYGRLRDQGQDGGKTKHLFLEMRKLVRYLSRHREIS